MGGTASSYRWVLAALTWLMMFALGASWFCFTPMMTVLAKEMALSYEQLGILVALVPLSLVVMCIPGGLFADRFGVRVAVSIGGTIMGIFGLLRGFATDFTTLAVSTFLCGVGYSIAYPNLPKVTGVWFSPKEYALDRSIDVHRHGGRHSIFIDFNSCSATTLDRILARCLRHDWSCESVNDSDLDIACQRKTKAGNWHLSHRFF